jgi:hypothetical protein
MAGKNPGFDAKAFRAGIHFVMQMGAPTESEDQATFYFPTQLVYRTGESLDVDAEGVPFDPAIPVTRHIPAGIKVPCAVEYQDANGVATDFGLVTPSRAVITLLDEDFSRVEGCSYVLLGGERFVYRHTEFPTGLFDVGVYTLHFAAEDQL